MEVLQGDVGIILEVNKCSPWIDVAGVIQGRVAQCAHLWFHKLVDAPHPVHGGQPGSRPFCEGGYFVVPRGEGPVEGMIGEYL